MTQPTADFLGIATVDRINGTIVVIGLTDGTTISLTVEELLALRPERQPADPESGSM